MSFKLKIYFNNIYSAGNDNGTEVYYPNQKEWVLMDPDSPRHHKIRHFSVVELPLEAHSSPQILLFGEFWIQK